MIFQGMTANNTDAIAEALTAAEVARQKLEQTQTELADADAALAELGVNVDGQET